MTTMFNSLHYHIISRCSTYNSRPPPSSSCCCWTFSVCSALKMLKIDIVVQSNVMVTVSSSDTPPCNMAPYLSLLSFNCNLTECFITSLSLSVAALFSPCSSQCAALSDVSFTTLFSVLDCKTYRRQNNSQNAWNAAVFPSWSGVVEGSRHKQSAVSGVATSLPLSLQPRGREQPRQPDHHPDMITGLKSCN